MKRFLKSKKGLALLATLVVVAASAIGAYAYFSSSGTGVGSASVGHSTGFTVASSAATGGALYPEAQGGSHIDTVDYTVTNGGSASEELNQVVISVANNDGSTWFSCSDSNAGDTATLCNDGSTPCTAADFSLNAAGVGTPVTDTSLAADLPAAGVADSSVSIELIDNDLNQDNCQNVTVPLYFQAS